MEGTHVEPTPSIAITFATVHNVEINYVLIIDDIQTIILNYLS